MKNIIKATALILGVSTILTLSPMFKANAAEFTDRPTTAAAFQNEIDDQIYAWREVVNKDDRDFEGFANLTILYYDKGDYANSYKAAEKTLKLYEKYDISVDDDFLREALVKGGASAYKLGKYRAAENILTKMLSYDLKGSKENQDSYNGMAYYYLAALAKDEGDYNQSYIYINNAVYFCPSHHIFLDFLDGFFWLHDRWYWRHSHVHYISYIMPHHRHHYYHPHHRHYKPVYHHRPATRAHVLPARDHVRAQAQRRVSAKPAQQHMRGPIRKTTTGQSQHQGIQRPVQRPQNHQNQGWRSSTQRSQQQQGQVQRPVQRPQNHQNQGWRSSTQRPQQQQGQVQRPVQRPQNHQNQGWRPAQRPQQQQGQVQRPVQRSQQQGQVQRPIQRSQQQGQIQRSQSQNQQQPVYRPHSNSSRQGSYHSPARSSGSSRSSGGHSQGHYGRRR